MSKLLDVIAAQLSRPAPPKARSRWDYQYRLVSEGGLRHWTSWDNSIERLRREAWDVWSNTHYGPRRMGNPPPHLEIQRSLCSNEGIQWLKEKGQGWVRSRNVALPIYAYDGESWGWR